MAVTFDGTRLDNADALGTLWVDTGNKAAVNEVDFVYQGSASVSEKVKTAELGVSYFNTGASVDYETTPTIVLIKCVVTTPAQLNTTGPSTSGLICEVGSGASHRLDYHRYYIHGSASYPPTGSWLIVAIDPNIVEIRDATVNTVAETAINYYGSMCTMLTGGAKSENMAMDALDYTAVGTGLTWLSTGGTFQDFVDADEGQQTSGRWGVVTTLNSILYVNAQLTIGASGTATGFDDTGAVVVFPDGLFGTGHLGMTIDVGNASSVIDMTDCTLIGTGHGSYAEFDQTATGVDTGTDIITSVAHGMNSGDGVTYSIEQGTVITGLTDATVYYVEAETIDSFSLHTTRQAAITAAAPISLTVVGTGTGSITRTDDTRPDLTGPGTSGASTLDGCTFTNVNAITLTSVMTITGCTFNTPGSLIMGDSTITSCVFDQPTTKYGTAFLTVGTTSGELAQITSSTFNSGTGSYGGHAIEITATTGTPFSFVGNLFTGYGPTHAEFDNTTGVSGTTITTDEVHSFTDGDEIYYGKDSPTAGTSGTVVGGLTDQTVYYVNNITSTTLSLHNSPEAAIAGTGAISLTTGSGNETHGLYSADAAIFNNAGGTTGITINISGGGDTPSVRNAALSGTTVVATTALTITGIPGNGVGGGS